MYLHFEQNLSPLFVSFAVININVFPEVSLVMNLLQELWSMLEFMMPDIFASEDVDLKKLLSAEDTDLISRMKSILGPFILRRLKSDVMQQLVKKSQQSLTSTVLKTALIPYLNSQLKKGIPLPILKGFALKNARIMNTLPWIVLSRVEKEYLKSYFFSMSI
ncbi:uncharacterized protein LOC131595769 [Vicia villosa]|uniref:uncharacterized protein LOC131595769 n=1 Tax=Vicia villosa TaxID=3911 RepID=UPI00273B86FA|nr:uncharacterized protein LOC131595769 [Vicia villosa]